MTHSSFFVICVWCPFRYCGVRLHVNITTNNAFRNVVTCSPWHCFPIATSPSASCLALEAMGSSYEVHAIQMHALLDMHLCTSIVLLSHSFALLSNPTVMNPQSRCCRHRRCRRSRFDWSFDLNMALLHRWQRLSLLPRASFGLLTVILVSSDAPVS